jgi:hypothetical protein
MLLDMINKNCGLISTYHGSAVGYDGKQKEVEQGGNEAVQEMYVRY